MKKASFFLFYLILNFAGLYLGALLSGEGASSDWYQSLDKAPWTPPGWVFGFAWTSIMICFSLYMTELHMKEKNKKNLIPLYALLWTVNLSWNPFFFYYHHVWISMAIILFLLFLTLYSFFKYYPNIKHKSWLISPYYIWLIVACSLNAFVCIVN